MESQDGLPDLVGSIDKIIEKNNSYYAEFSITNIGDAPAEGFSIEVTAYPFGKFFLRNSLFDSLLKILPRPLFDLIAISLYIMGFFPSFIMKQNINSTNQLMPGESHTNNWYMSFFNPDFYTEWNIKTCIILECIVDKDKLIRESNEFNNRDVIRWWFPLRDEPPK